MMGIFIDGKMMKNSKGRVKILWGLLGVVSGAALMAVSFLIDSDGLFLVASVLICVAGYLFFAR